MRSEGRRGDLSVEELIGIVLPALQFRNDDSAFGLAFRRVEQAIGHPLGLQEQHLVEGAASGGFEICRLIDPRITVPHATDSLDDALHLFAGDVDGPLEIHVLDPM